MKQGGKSVLGRLLGDETAALIPWQFNVCLLLAILCFFGLLITYVWPNPEKAGSNEVQKAFAESFKVLVGASVGTLFGATRRPNGRVAVGGAVRGLPENQQERGDEDG